MPTNPGFSQTTLYYWKYELISSSSLNAKSQRTKHPGALIRHPDGGVGCLHPWPELGDLDLDTSLALLSRGELTPLSEVTLTCAQIDSNARQEGRSLFEYPIPESHWTFTDLKQEDPESIAALGYQTGKVKCNTDRASTSQAVESLAKVGMRIRLDFNEILNLDKFLDLWDLLSPYRDHIEFVEDPISSSPADWDILRKAGVPIAVDRAESSLLIPEDYFICKPAMGNMPTMENPCVITSYMDHAIGQMWAALQASQARRLMGESSIPTCGLHTHECFESDAFFEQIATEGNRLRAPEGTGLGFDELLDSLPWKKLA